MTLLNKIKQSTISNKLFEKGEHILIGVSGGMDSVALLYCLNDFKHELGIHLSVAHFNHNLREHSEIDEYFVKKLSAKLNLSCYSETCKKSARKTSGSLEEFAREQRLDFFLRLAKARNIKKIALAHHQDDLAETVLMRILRGSGLCGLRAMLPKRIIKDIIVIRPFLDVKKAEIHNYIKSKGYSFCVDPTNKDLKYFRNKIRHQLLPLLEHEYNKDCKQVLSNLSQTTSLDYDFLDSFTEKVFQRHAHTNPKKRAITFKLREIKKLHKAIQRVLIRKATQKLRANSPNLSLKHIVEIENLIEQRPAGSIVNLPQKQSVQKQKEILIIRNN